MYDKKGMNELICSDSTFVFEVYKLYCIFSFTSVTSIEVVVTSVIGTATLVVVGATILSATATLADTVNGDNKVIIKTMLVPSLRKKSRDFTRWWRVLATPDAAK